MRVAAASLTAYFTLRLSGSISESGAAYRVNLAHIDGVEAALDRKNADFLASFGPQMRR
jgi:hypothetical protein